MVECSRILSGPTSWDEPPPGAACNSRRVISNRQYPQMRRRPGNPRLPIPVPRAAQFLRPDSGNRLGILVETNQISMEEALIPAKKYLTIWRFRWPTILWRSKLSAVQRSGAQWTRVHRADPRHPWISRYFRRQAFLW